MLMAIDKRKKILKNLRLTNYESFEKVCEELGITYTFPPEYYRRVTHRWLAKKAFCIKVAARDFINLRKILSKFSEDKNSFCLFCGNISVGFCALFFFYLKSTKVCIT